MTPPEEPRDLPDPDDIGCLAAIEKFYAYLDGELDGPQEVEGFEHHMEHCRSCFSRAELEGLLTERLRKVAARQAPDALKKRLRHLMARF